MIPCFALMIFWIVISELRASPQAALAGLGYALVRRGLVEAELAAGQLLCVQATALHLPMAYYLVYLPETLIEPSMGKFRDWIMAL